MLNHYCTCCVFRLLLNNYAILIIKILFKCKISVQFLRLYLSIFSLLRFVINKSQYWMLFMLLKRTINFIYRQIDPSSRLIRH